MEAAPTFDAPAAPSAALSGDPDRPPLPAGDPLAWDLLVRGTWLAGTSWPGWGSLTEALG